MTRFYTSSKGESVEIASMVYNHLKSAHDKAVRTEERKHDEAFRSGEAYSNDEREGEISAMAAELARRDVGEDSGV